MYQIFQFILMPLAIRPCAKVQCTTIHDKSDQRSFCFADGKIFELWFGFAKTYSATNRSIRQASNCVTWWFFSLPLKSCLLVEFCCVAMVFLFEWCFIVLSYHLIFKSIWNNPAQRKSTARIKISDKNSTEEEKHCRTHQRFICFIKCSTN